MEKKVEFRSIKHKELAEQLNNWFSSQTEFKLKKDLAVLLEIHPDTLGDYFSGRKFPKSDNAIKLYKITKLNCLKPIDLFSDVICTELSTDSIIPPKDENTSLTNYKKGDSMKLEHTIISVTSAENSETTNVVRSENTEIKDLYHLIMERYNLGKVPLFVLGAGISAGIVPFMFQMAQFLVDSLDTIREKSNNDKRLKSLKLQGTLIAQGKATRNEAAEFFATFQSCDEEDPLGQIWREFCLSLVQNGYNMGDNKGFLGLLKLQSGDTTYAHRSIAGMLSIGACHVLNLNFDHLLYLAFEQLRKADSSRKNSRNFNLIALHDPDEILRYYFSPDKYFQPAVTNARGDIFYVRCRNISCPQHNASHPVDLHRANLDPDTPLKCPACHLEKLSLELAFPGYQTKEMHVEPIIKTLAECIGVGTSAIIIVGLSGRWDPYLLGLLFDWARTYSIPLLDVKPELWSGAPSDHFLEEFREAYFPAIPDHFIAEGACYIKGRSTADDFLKTIYPIIRHKYDSLPLILNMEMLVKTQAKSIT